MQFADLNALLRSGPDVIGPGPIALIFAEDGAALLQTVRHHRSLGFQRVIVLAAPGVDATGLQKEAIFVPYDPSVPDAISHAVNSVAARARPGTWLFYCFNAEFLFFPFCDTRDVSEMLAFHSEERRDAMLCFVVDLYSGDIALDDFGISLANAFFDAAGYYAEDRRDPEGDWLPVERQQDFFGGLRWRFEEHVPHEHRRIDRVALFRTEAKRRLLEDHRLTDPEANTVQGPWHNTLTAAICSFRAAKALRINPGSRQAVHGFMWQKSVAFDWSPQQLLDHGLMEPGQWF